MTKSRKKIKCDYCGKYFYKRELKMHIEDTHLKYERKQSNLQKIRQGIGVDVHKLPTRKIYQIDESGLIISNEDK